jgi:transcription antitermination factor NusG
MNCRVAKSEFAALAPDEAIPDLLDGQWWVAHTRSRHEKALAKELTRKDIFTYLPLHETRTRSPRTGRLSFSTVPVFTGYLFVNATESQRYQVMATNRVANTLFVPDQRQLVSQLRDIHRVLMTKAAITCEHGVRVGQQVRVVAGVLAGVEGRVLRRLGKTRLAVSVDTLGQSVLVEVDADCLEPIDAGDSVPAVRSEDWR